MAYQLIPEGAPEGGGGGGGTEYVIGAGLTDTAGTLTNDFATGKTGGQTLTGGTAADNNLTIRSTSDASKGKIVVDSPIAGATTASGNLDLRSTTHATKGRINLGAAATNYFDEVNSNLVITGRFLSPFGSIGYASDTTGWARMYFTGAANTTATINFDAGGAVVATMALSGLVFADGKNVGLGATTGTKIGTTTSQKLGFWNVTPVVQQVLATGSTADQIITLLQTLGLCRQS